MFEQEETVSAVYTECIQAIIVEVWKWTSTAILGVLGKVGW